ncbi:chromate transporter [Paenibacillus hunanensis]|uniref:chromate transporter n=1 Tax=Paenibacillus hunanensis TaxID=539262 RepID=UPI002A69CB92|nr:chromate transporter [Paenibacillus hunanensis]WPP40521.1 chromate transporter [Paenibacillus hunanensis]
MELRNVELQKGRQGRIKRLLEIGMVSTRLGLTSFGGPIAHLGYFHEEYVRRRKWLNEQQYAELVALCQFLPGPASSQVGIGIGVIRAGILGGIVSFLGFTLPSVIALMIFALIVQQVSVEGTGWLHGLKLVAVAIVAQAILGMAPKLTPDLKRKAIALLAMVAVLLWQTVYTQLIVIALAGLIGYIVYRQQAVASAEGIHFPISRTIGVTCLLAFFALLALLPVLRELTSLHWVAMIDRFYRAGSLVFGGGHVVLPLLEREFVPNGQLSEQAFLAGYGATQAVPGPLFTFAAYLGTVMEGWSGGIIATVAIFLPAFLLVLGALPFWNDLRHNAAIQGAFMGVNAAVVGILIAAWYDPIWTSSIRQPIDFAFAAILFSMLVFWKLPPWMVVIAGAGGGWLLSLIIHN